MQFERKFLRSDSQVDDNFEWNGFGRFTGWTNYEVWKIVIQNDVTDSSCTCPSYLKKLVCKYVLGMLIKRKKVNVPSAVKRVPLSQKRKRGKLSKVKRALLVHVWMNNKFRFIKNFWDWDFISFYVQLFLYVRFSKYYVQTFDFLCANDFSFCADKYTPKAIKIVSSLRWCYSAEILSNCAVHIISVDCICPTQIYDREPERR